MLLELKGFDYKFLESVMDDKEWENKNKEELIIIIS